MLFFILTTIFAMLVVMQPRKVYINPGLEIYVIDFYIYMGMDYKDNKTAVILKDTWKKSKKTVVGECFNGDDEYNYVYIDKDHWNKITETQREQLMFHELGHCVLKLNHDNRVFPDLDIAHPKHLSIMYHEQMPDDQYVENWEYYIDELKVKTNE